MKKYLLTSILSLTLAVIIIIHLYKTKDIEWIDKIVEKSSEALGIEPQVVTEKVQRKIRERQVAQSEVLAELASSEKDSLAPTVEATGTDSVSELVPPLVHEKKQHRLFNADVTPVAGYAEVGKKDSVAMPQPEVPMVPIRKLFNASIDTKENSRVTNKADQVVFFKAEVNTPQRFKDDQEIAFRTSEVVTIGSSVIPEKIVFQAKANVFDGRIHFIVRSINDVPVKGENYKEQLPGMPISSDFRLDESYFLSEGFPVVFGVKL